MSLNPVVAEQTERGERVSSIVSLLLGGRTIYCEPSVTNESLNLPVVHFLCFDYKGLGKGASLSANRLSEAVSGGLAINDTTQYARSGASTLCWKQGTYTAGWHSFVGSEKRRPYVIVYLHHVI